jgi:hypothetical protein
LPPIDGQHHGVHVGIHGRQLLRSVLAGRQHLLGAVDGVLEGIVRQANRVRVRSLRPQLADRPMPSEAAMTQPTHHVPA